MSIILVIIVSIGASVKASEKYINKYLDGSNNDVCPSDMVFIGSASGGFCMDIYENSASDKCPAINPNSQVETRLNIDNPDCKSLSKSGVIPWRYISQNQAAVACAKSGKRLPTNKEWLAAALGTPDKISSWDTDDCQVNNNWSNQPGLTGSGQKCKSPSGVYDMIGNIWEWVDGTVKDGQYKGKILPKEGYIVAVDEDAFPSKTGDAPDDNSNRDYLWIKDTNTRGIARGGYWGNGFDAGEYATYIVSEPSFVGDGVGFRCVK